MKINKLLLLLALLPFMASCQDKFSGKDEQSFKISRAKIEKQLSENEKTNLEKAMRVIAVQAMQVKWSEPEKYKGKSFDEISLELVDGLSYTALTNLAEKILKEEKLRNIKQIEKEILELENQKTKYLQLKSKLDLLEAKPLKIDLIDGQLVVSCSFTNHSKEEIKSYSTVIGYSSNKDRQDGWNCSNSYDNSNEIAPNETKIYDCKYDFESAKKQSKAIAWDKIKFPITDFAKYNIVVNCRTEQLTINGTDYKLGRNKFDQDAEKSLQNKNEKLIEYQQLKGTLNEMELVN